MQQDINPVLQEFLNDVRQRQKSIKREPRIAYVDDWHDFVITQDRIRRLNRTNIREKMEEIGSTFARLDKLKQQMLFNPSTLQESVSVIKDDDFFDEWNPSEPKTKSQFIEDKPNGYDSVDNGKKRFARGSQAPRGGRRRKSRSHRRIRRGRSRSRSRRQRSNRRTHRRR